jgi:hypothetical protein
VTWGDDGLSQEYGVLDSSTAAGTVDITNKDVGNPTWMFGVETVTTGVGGSVSITNDGDGSTVLGLTANASAGAAVVVNSGRNSVVSGYIEAPQGTHTMSNLGDGCIMFGVVDPAGASTGAGSMRVASNAEGSMVFGYVNASSTGTAILNAGHDGCLAHGVVETGTIDAAGEGAYAHGLSDGGTGSSVRATGEGSIAGGWSRTGGVISSTSPGGIAHGRTEGAGAGITSAGQGSFAMGYALNGTQIGQTSGASGSFAIGAPIAGEDIICAFRNTWQFGAGTNSTTESLQVMETIELAGATGTVTANEHIGPSTPGEAISYFLGE